MSFDEEIDFLVVGSGGGGMTAALVAHDAELKTLVVEKAATFGGTTALSGGALWMPNNGFMSQAGLADSPAEALAYLKDLTAGRVTESRLRAYVDYAPKMVQYLTERSRVRFIPTPGRPDYYPERTGGKIGRSVEAAPYASRSLGVHESELLRGGQLMALNRVALTAQQAHSLMQRSVGAYLSLTKKFASYAVKGLVGYRKTSFDTHLTLGSALEAAGPSPRPRLLTI